MKKESLKLSLRKEVISNLQAQSIMGGDPQSNIDNGGNCSSDNGCTTGADQTMTCNSYGC